MLRSGRIPAIPRLHAVQARAVMPLAAAYLGETAPPTSSTIAGGIAVANPPRLRQSLRALRETAAARSPSTKPTSVRWQTLLARHEGVFVEPTSAAAFAGVEALIANGAIGRAESILVAATGFGLKDAIPGTDTDGQDG